MPLTREQVMTKVVAAITKTLRNKAAVRPADRFVNDLGFDSLKMATLSIALEAEIGVPLLLNDWISASNDPSALTVDSLADYLTEALRDEV